MGKRMGNLKFKICRQSQKLMLISSMPFCEKNIPEEKMRGESTALAILFD
jgi:hypothetical protein